MNISQRELPILGKTYSKLGNSFIVLNDTFQIMFMNDYAKELLNLNDSKPQSTRDFNSLLSPYRLELARDNGQYFIKSEPIRIKNHLKHWVLIQGTLDETPALFLLDKDVTEHEDLFKVLEQATSEVTGQRFDKRLSAQEYMDEIRGCLERVIKQMPCYVYWKDSDFHYIFCNDITANIMGLNSPDEAIGKTDYDFGWDKELVDTYRATDTKILNTGEAVLNLEEDLIDKDGRVYSTLVNKLPLKNSKGEIIGILGITVDITDVKKAEVAKADFISNMEHDLKTPFSGIGGIANLLFDTETDPSKKELLGLMVKSCNQWERVHHRIFEAITVENHNELHLEHVSLTQELTEISEMMATTVRFKNIEFIIESIPTEIDSVKTDKFKFHLILSSIIGNAINFTAQGSVTVRVSKEVGGLRISVIDTGIGIPEDKIDYIFEKFSKLSPSNKYGSDFKGVGLGLYVAKQCANQLGASLTVKSAERSGSTFTLKIPLIH